MKKVVREELLPRAALRLPLPAGRRALAGAPFLSGRTGRGKGRRPLGGGPHGLARAPALRLRREDVQRLVQRSSQFLSGRKQRVALPLFVVADGPQGDVAQFGQLRLGQTGLGAQLFQFLTKSHRRALPVKFTLSIRQVQYQRNSKIELFASY